MYSIIKLGWLYVRYWLTASNGSGHGIHSPFVYKLVTEVLNDKRNFYAFGLIEARRAALLASEKRAVYPIKYGTLLFRLVNYFGAQTIVELGSSHGIACCYLAAANASANVVTLEKPSEDLQIAKQSFEAAQLNNVQLVINNFDNAFLSVLQQMEKVDIISISGEYGYLPVIEYFNQSLPFIGEKTVIIVHKIHSSAEMDEAWIYIKEHPSVSLSIDLFFLGLVFFRTEQAAKEHFTIRY